MTDPTPQNVSFSATGPGRNSGSLTGGAMVVDGGSIIVNNELMADQVQGSMIPNLSWIKVVTNANYNPHTVDYNSQYPTITGVTWDA